MFPHSVGLEALNIDLVGATNRGYAEVIYLLTVIYAQDYIRTVKSITSVFIER